ncbi:MAG TPA: hypothetical protein VJC15_00115 [Candidatus Paceibacterota bacterium]
MHAYSEGALAQGATLALLRLQHTGAMDDVDQSNMQTLLRFLDDAREMAELIYRGSWPLAFARPIGMYSVICRILLGLNVRAENGCHFLERLHATVQTIVENGEPNEQDLARLQSFLQGYRMYWDQKLPKRGC